MKTKLFSALAAVSLFALSLAALPAAAQEWGNLKGRVVYGGEKPAVMFETISADKEFCSPHKPVNESIVVGDGNGLANVVVFLYVATGGKAPAVHPSYEETAKAVVEMNNEKCRFEPHVVLLRTTQTLALGNKDTVGHNSKVDTFSTPSINPIIPAGGVYEHSLPAEERLPARVSCSIHPWMRGWIVVKESPYMAVTNEKGEFEIANLPVGSLTFQFWQETAGYLDKVQVDGKDTAWARGRVDVEIKPGDNDLGTITVPAAEFK